LSTISWISTTGGDWSQGSNWQGDVVPGSSDDAVVNVTVAEAITVSGTASVDSVTFADPGGSFTLETSGVLDVAHDVILSAGTVVIDGQMLSGGTISITGENGIAFGSSATLAAGFVQFNTNGTIDISAPVTAITSVITTGGTVTVVPAAVACFAAGTGIDTPTGEAFVENLAPGDLVTLARGSTAPVVWIGRRHVDCARHPDPHAVWPIRIKRGAFADDMPRHDLILSPDHAIYAEGVLVPIRFLVNHRTIIQERRDQVTYLHVELPRHDILLAHGLPVESYLETGNRSAFENGGSVTQLHPNFSVHVWEAQGCAPLVITGDEFQRIVKALRRRTREWRRGTISTAPSSLPQRS
jgi:collagen type I alpha